MDQNSNALNWFEIPATDIHRARKFYETVFATQLTEPSDMMGFQMSMFPAGEGKLGGALMQGPHVEPGGSGSIVYFNANPSIQACFDRIEGAGGVVVVPITKISDEIGYFAWFMDTEGNRVAMHSGKP